MLLLLLVDRDVHLGVAGGALVNHLRDLFLLPLGVQRPVVIALRVENMVVRAVKDLVCHLEILPAKATLHLVGVVHLTV